MSIIISKTALAPSDAPIVMPVDGLLLWATPGVSATRSLRNYAREDAPMAVSGAPAFGARYADLKSVTGAAAFFNSGVPATMAEWTLVEISAPLGDPTADVPQAITTLEQSGGAWRGFGLGRAASGGASRAARGSFAGLTSASPSTSVEVFVQTPATALDPMMIRATAFRGAHGGVMRVDDLTEGTSAQTTDSRTAVAASNLPGFRVGSSGNGTNRYGACRMYFAAIVSRFATDTELDRLVGQAVRSLAADGVSVTLAT